MAKTRSSQHAFLLQLPLELLQRIIDLLSDETIIMLRLSCKVLQATTFDVFAREYFTKRKICIADKARWTQLSSILDSRLATRLKKLTFTIINDRTDEFQLAPGREFSDMSAAQSHEEDHVTDPSVKACGQISAYQIGCVSNQIKQNLSGLAVKLDFEDYMTSDSLDPRVYNVCRSLLQAVTFHKLPLVSLTLSPSSIGQLSTCFGQNQTKPLGLTSSLKTFHYLEGRGGINSGQSVSKSSHKTIDKILESATSLQKLDICMLSYPFRGGRAMTLAKFLAASRLQDIHTLWLSDVDIAEADLLHALSRCTDSLTHLELRWIQLRNVSQGWPSIFRSILAKTQIETLVFTSLEVNDDSMVICFDSLAGSEKMSNQDISLEGRDQIEAGLQQLLSAPLTLVELDF